MIFIKEIKNIEYIALHKNTGIAYALNIGCEKAINDGMDVIVTFDQDTVCEKNTIHALLTTLKRINTPVIVAPNIKYIYRSKGTGERIFSDEKMFPVGNEYVNWVITSGSMFRSSTFDLIGKFDTRLFISQVDQDFCYRLKQNGGKVYRVGYAYIYQEPGNTKKKKIGNKIIHIPNQDKTLVLKNPEATQSGRTALLSTEWNPVFGCGHPESAVTDDQSFSQ